MDQLQEVFIVRGHDAMWRDVFIEGVFSSDVKAQEHIDKLPEDKKYDYIFDIQKYKIDGN